VDTFCGSAMLALSVMNDRTRRANLVDRALSVVNRVTETKGSDLEGALFVWCNLVESAIDLGPSFNDATASLVSSLDNRWAVITDTLAKNPRDARAYAWFLSGVAASFPDLSAALTGRALDVARVAPGALGCYSKLLKPELWGDGWHEFMALLWNACGASGNSVVESRLAVLDLLSEWLVRGDASAELPDDTGFLVDFAFRALVDESPIVANHAAYSVVRMASRQTGKTHARRTATALVALASDVRLDVRGAAAYACKAIKREAAPTEILEAIDKIEKRLTSETYAVLRRQQVFGKLDLDARDI
jgi:hypothetical protein